jgi:hypothetical protein
MIKFRCHNCHKKIGVQEDFIGKQVWCPRCSVPTTVPQPNPANTQSGNPNEKTIYSVFVCHGLSKEA